MKKEMIKANEIIETNNDAVLYSIMLSFLKRKAKEYKLDIDDLYIAVDESGNSIDVFEIESDYQYPQINHIEGVKVN